MKSTTLLAEYLIIGFVCFILLVLIYLNVIENIEFEKLLELKNISIGTSILLTVIFYILGIITHRTLSSAKNEHIRWMLEFKIASIFFSREDRELILNPQEAKMAEKYYKVLNYASVTVNEKLKNYESLTRIFKSLIFLLPLISVLGFYYFYSISLPVSLVFIVLGFLLSYLSFKSHRLVKHRQIQLISQVYKLLQTMET